MEAPARLFIDILQRGRGVKLKVEGTNWAVFPVKQLWRMLRFRRGRPEKRRDASFTVAADTEQEKSDPLYGLSCVAGNFCVSMSLNRN